MSVLSLRNISFSYGKTPVLKDISYDFEKGKMYCIIGKSGAGKTTLLSLLSGLATPNAGEIIYDEENGLNYLAVPSFRLWVKSNASEYSKAISFTHLYDVRTLQ